MSRRLDIELTSAPDEATFTWRAAGARQPKGTVPASTLPAGSSVGDVLKVEIEVGLDGTEVSQVIPQRSSRSEPERIELVGQPVADDALVTSRLAPKGRGRPRGERRDRSDRPARRPGSGPGDRRAEGRRRDEAARAAKASERGDRSSRGPKRSPTPTPTAAARPKAPRLRAKREHRKAVLDALPPEQRVVAEQVLRSGLAGVRQGIEAENAERRSRGESEVQVDGIVAMAEDLLPRLHTAEWHDRADAALAAIDTVDLRDLRSVVVAADDNAKDETTRALATELRAKLAERVERSQREWLAELDSALNEKRVVRAIKLSSRPPKAGAPLPADLATRIVDAATAALTPESGQGRWVAVIDALAFSPVRHRVVPVALPAEPSEELLALVTRVADASPGAGDALRHRPRDGAQAHQPATRRRPQVASRRPTSQEHSPAASGDEPTSPPRDPEPEPTSPPSEPEPEPTSQPSEPEPEPTDAESGEPQTDH